MLEKVHKHQQLTRVPQTYKYVCLWKHINIIIYIYICLSNYATTVVLRSCQDGLSKGFLHCWMPLLFYTREMTEWAFIHMHEHSWKSSSHLLGRITQLTSNEQTACLTEISWSMSFSQSYWILLAYMYCSVLQGKKQQQRHDCKFPQEFSDTSKSKWLEQGPHSSHHRNTNNHWYLLGTLIKSGIFYKPTSGSSVFHATTHLGKT